MQASLRFSLSALFALLFGLLSCETPVEVTTNCGDAVIDPGEECDGSNLPVQNCEQLGYYSQTGDLVCTSECQLDLSVCASRCGDDQLQAQYGEECDGTNLGGESCESLGMGEGTLGCTVDCQHDTSGCTNAYSCGDGTINTPYEDCEGDDLLGETCEGLGFYGGVLACDDDCRFDTSVCETFGRCGDGILHTNDGEECEGADLNGQSCEGLDYHGGTLTCGNDCRFILDDCVAAGICGDATFQDGTTEECDAEDLDDQTCESLGHYAGTLACTADCLFDETGCLSCGDDLIQAATGEKCDGTALDGENCVSQGFYTGTLACTMDCANFDTTNCSGSCGDGQVQTAFGEDCDGANLNGATCSSAGLGFGALSCNGTCDFNGAACTTVTGLATGYSHSCALLTGGTVRCWGQGALGRLGNGSTASSSVSVAATGLTTALRLGTAITAHTCAVLADNTMKCWGYNATGQLGDGTMIDRISPVAVSGITGATHAGTGYDFSCARLTSGAVKCWGANHIGQLGNGSTTPSLTPVTVSGITDATQIAVGFNHACAIVGTGSVKCWGSNFYGQLGNGNRTDATSPVSVSSITTAVQIVAGEDHTCVRLTAGNIKCWGHNDAGQLGHGDTSDSSIPVDVSAGNSIITIACGMDHCCAVENTGSVLCWGANGDGQLGNGLTVNRTSPVTVSGISTATLVSGGGRHSCALLSTGTVQCWGWNDHGQLGDGSVITRLFPVFAQ